MTVLKLWLILNEIALIFMIEWKQRYARGH